LTALAKTNCDDPEDFGDCFFLTNVFKKPSKGIQGMSVMWVIALNQNSGGKKLAPAVCQSFLLQIKKVKLVTARHS